MSDHQPKVAHFPPNSAAFGLGLGLIILLYFSISHLTLSVLGFNYEETGGTVFEKVHPGTLAAIAVLGLAGLFRRNPIGEAGHALLQKPATTIYLVLIALLIAHAIWIVGLPFTAFIDTFVAPAIVYFLFRDLDEQRARRLAWLIHVFVIINALVGMAEFATGVRLTPLVANGVEITDDWRSTALFGHPLLNASLTGAYLLALAAGAGRELNSVLRSAAFIIAAGAMIVFGGRAATVLLLAFVVLILALRGLDVARGARFSVTSLIRALVAVPLIVLVLLALAEYGYFDLFLQRFLDDRGSAETRIDMFQLFRHISWSDLIFSPDQAQIITLQRLYGLDFGIESFWISFILKSGLLLSLPFFAAMFAFCGDVLGRTRAGAGWVVLFFFAVASTSVSLSAKTPLFAMIVIMLLVLFRDDRRPKRATASGLRHSANPTVAARPGYGPVFGVRTF